MVDEEIVERPENTPENDEQGEKKKKGATWKYVLNISLVLIVSVIAVYLAVRSDAQAIFQYLLNSDYRFLLIIVGLMIVYFVIRSFMLFAFARLFTRDYYFHRAVAVEFIGSFYAAVTPGGQGGEVMQAYTYKKQGIPISSAISALAMYSILYQIVLILYGIVSLIFKYQFIENLPNVNLGTYGDVTLSLPMWVLTIIGFGLNVGYIGIVLAMSYWKGFHNFMMGPVIGFLHKIRIVKDANRSRESLRTQIENFKMESRRLFTNIPFTILISLCFFASMTIRFAIPYFVGLAMHNESSCASFWDAVFLSNYHQMASGLIPIPGSAGVSEFIFNSLFSTYPATPETSFYFVNATLDSQEFFFNQMKADPAGFGSFLRSIAYKITNGVDVSGDGIFDGNDLEQTLIGLSANASYADLDGGDALLNLKEAVIYYANYHESTSLASASLVLWRFVTFTLPLVAAGFVTAFYRASPKEESASSDRLPNRHTLVDLQRETYSDRAILAETMVETSRLTRESIANRLKSLARLDRRKKRKEKKEAEMRRREEEVGNEIRDVSVDKEDDSL